MVQHVKQTSPVNLPELETRPSGRQEEARRQSERGCGTSPTAVRGKNRFAIVSLALLVCAALAGLQFGSHHGKPEWVSWLLALPKRITGSHLL